MTPSRTSQTRVASPFTKLRLWETKSSVPSYLVSASISASDESRSRWLVGSSMRRKLEGTTSSRASATRARSPPESTPMRFSTSSPEKRKEPSTPRTQLWACVGTNPWISSRMVRAASRRSVWCCAQYVRGQVPVDGRGSVGLRHPIQAGDLTPTARRLGKAESHGGALFAHLHDLFLLQQLDSALHLPSLRRLGTEALDEGLHLGAP